MHRHDDPEGHGEDEAEMQARADREAREQRAHDPAHESGEAPQAVEGRHDAAAVQPFHAHGLRIHGNVVQVRRHAEKHQRGEKLPDHGGEPEGHQRARIQGGGEEEHPPAAEPADQIAGQGHGRHLPDGDGEQDPAELGFVEAESLLDVGDAGGPTGEDQPLKEEKGPDREPVNVFGRVRQCNQ